MNDQPPDSDPMAERQAICRKDLYLLIRIHEAVGTEVMPVLAEALTYDLRAMASINKDLAARYALMLVQDILSAVNPVPDSADLIPYRH